jgi:hypothetical protein
MPAGEGSEHLAVRLLELEVAVEGAADVELAVMVAVVGASTAKLTFRCTLRLDRPAAWLDVRGIHVGQGARPLVWGGD